MAIDLFNLVGKVSVNYVDAVKDIGKVSDAADNAAESLDDMGDAADNAESPVRGSGDAAKDADGKFSTWKVTLANLASSAIQSVISKCTDLAKSVVGLGEDFTSMMSEVQAISGATDEEMAQMEATARQFGATTVFSATDAAEALKYMSLAGWTAEQSTSALGGVLDLAAASGMELGQASDMVTDYLSAFGMEAEDAAYFADMLSFAQSNSNTTAEQLGEAYRNCAANLNAAGQDVETVTSLLEAMANQGYKGSEAGTALAAIMRDITNAMDDGKISIGDTTISVMDANGNFRDLTDILTEVEAATDGMGDAERAAALSSTFTADSTKGLNLILNESMGKVAGYEEALRNADGTASDMAATMNDNLKGDLANMNSAFEELGLKIYDGLEQPLRSAIQFVTNKVIPAITTFGQNLDTIAPIFLGIATAVGIFIVALNFSSIVSTVVNVLNGLKGAILAVNAAMSANPIMLIVSLIAGLVVAIVTLWGTNEDFRNKVIEIWKAIKTVIETILSTIKTTITTVWNAINTTVTTVVNIIRTVVTTVWSSIKLVISTIMNAIRTTVSSIWNSIKSTVSSVVNAIKSVISSVFNAVKSTVSSILNSIKSTFSSVWNAIKSTVSSVINGIKSTISEGLQGAFSTVSNVLNDIKNKFSSIFESAKNIVRNAIDTIKGFFNFSWSLPKLKLPHFSISGAFSLNPPSVPHFGIEWYRKAMDEPYMFTKPTIFDVNPVTGQAKGAGEAGDELMIGKETLLNMIRSAVLLEDNGTMRVLQMILDAILKLDEDLVGKFVESLEQMKFTINDREFARLVKKVN